MKCRVRVQPVRVVPVPRRNRQVQRIRLIHPNLHNSSVLICRYPGREHWELISAYLPNGQLGDPLKILWETGLELSSYTEDRPRLIDRQGE